MLNALKIPVLEPWVEVTSRSLPVVEPTPCTSVTLGPNMRENSPVLLLDSDAKPSLIVPLLSSTAGGTWNSFVNSPEASFGGSCGGAPSCTGGEIAEPRSCANSLVN